MRKTQVGVAVFAAMSVLTLKGTVSRVHADETCYDQIRMFEDLNFNDEWDSGEAKFQATSPVTAQPPAMSPPAEAALWEDTKGSHTTYWQPGWATAGHPACSSEEEPGDDEETGGNG